MRLQVRLPEAHGRLAGEAALLKLKMVFTVQLKFHLKLKLKLNLELNFALWLKFFGVELKTALSGEVEVEFYIAVEVVACWNSQ